MSRIFRKCCPGYPVIETGIEERLPTIEMGMGEPVTRIVTTVFSDNEDNNILFTNRTPDTEGGMYDSDDIYIICSRCGKRIEWCGKTIEVE